MEKISTLSKRYSVNVGGGENSLMVVILTCSIHMTIYYYVDNASIISTPSESYFA
jgi:hypothetical protein